MERGNLHDGLQWYQCWLLEHLAVFQGSPMRPQSRAHERPVVEDLRRAAGRVSMRDAAR